MPGKGRRWESWLGMLGSGLSDCLLGSGCAGWGGGAGTLCSGGEGSAGFVGFNGLVPGASAKLPGHGAGLCALGGRSLFEHNSTPLCR